MNPLVKADKDAILIDIIENSSMQTAAEWMKNNASPSECTSEMNMRAWAIENGYTPPGE